MKKKFLLLFVTFCATLQISVAASGLTGVCGENVTYRFNKNTNILTLSGSGALYDYEYYNDLPWYGYSSQIEHVELGGGVKAPLWTLSRKIAIACGRMKKEKVKPITKTDIVIADDNEHTFSGDTMDNKLH